MIERENTTGETQVIHHPAHGTMVRPPNELMFHICGTREYLGRDIQKWQVVPWYLVPKESLQLKKTRKSQTVVCVECKESFPRTETDQGVCRGCMCAEEPLDVCRIIPLGGVCEMV